MFVSALGDQGKAFEIAEAVIDHTRYFAGELVAFRVMADDTAPNTLLRWIDAASISTKAIHPAGHLLNVSLKHRVPPVRRGDRFVLGCKFPG